MRLASIVFLAGVLSLGIGIAARAAEVTPRQAGNAVIEIPSDWTVYPRAITEQFSGGGVDILMLAQGPADGFPKLTIIRSPDSTTQEAFRKLDVAETKELCRTFNGNLESEFGKGEVQASCARVENKGVPALASRMVIPAEGERPELVSMTWSYPNGKKGIIATAMFLSKDVQQFESTIKKAFASVRFDQ